MISTTPTDDAAAWLRLGLERHCRVLIVGFHQGPLKIEVSRVFVPLHVYADRARIGAGPNAKDKNGLAPSGAEISFEEALACASDGRTCLALIGDPGSGKTTLLRDLFRRVVRGEMTDISHLGGMHPVMVRLGTVADDEMVSRGLARIVERVAREDGYPNAGPAILARPTQEFLFLLDGLDEVRDEPTRARVCKWLNEEIDHWPGCAFVVTSRRAAWARTPLLATRFLPVSVQGLRSDAIATYVHLWFGAIERYFSVPGDLPPSIENRAQRKAAALLDVFASPSWRATTRLLEMTSNPLMLSTLCLAHHRETRLPDQRGELYELTLGLLLAWTSHRVGGPGLRLESTRLVLQPLAYQMHERDQRELSISEAAELVRGPLAEVPALRPIAPTAEQFLDLVRDECGVITSRDLGLVEFVHLSLQEYLAACHVAERGLGTALADRAGDPRWEEVTLLAMSRPGVFAPFMTRALERGDATDALLRQCLGDAVRIDPSPFEAAADRALARSRTPWRLLTNLWRWALGRPALPSAATELQRLFTLVQGYDLPGLVERARTAIDSSDRTLRAAARRLVGLEESSVPREGAPFVEAITGMSFAWIPGGMFVMGSRAGAPGAYPDEMPAHRVQITGHWMSIYPVTNAHYARFVAEAGHPAPASFADRRFNDSAQPVVTVTWEDARAFTAWLGSILPDGIEARLPTESEWEYVARGADGRSYPWGDAPPDPRRATFDQPYDSGQPSIVGRTPAGKSPFGVHDLAGNVLEWCIDAWSDNYSGREDYELDPYRHVGARGVPRVLRGGSWFNAAWFLRCAYRLREHPQRSSQHIGFRVVCGGARLPDAN